MLDKLLLNNQIITNKKKIQQARIQTINKLVQKIRKLKTLSEKKPNNAKIKQNLSKTPEILACVKKIKIADVIRRILTLSKKPAAILTNGQASPEDVAVALLASNKILLDFTTTLKSLLHLDENNPGWKEEIMELSRRKKKLLQSGERKKNRKLEKANKKPAVKKNPWREENVEDAKNEAIDSEDISPARGWKVEPLGDVNLKSTESVKPKPIFKKKENEVKENGFKSVKEENQSIDDTPLPDKSNKTPVTTVDSFFFTETGDSYLSTVVIDRVQPEAPDDGLVRRERRNNTRPYQRNNNNRRQPVQTGRVDRRQSFASLNTKPQIPDEKLHPSWAAKQKLKPSITQFKGQKITFDDDGENSQPKSTGKGFHKSNSQDKNAGKPQDQANLHPSWAAKQKLKPAITEFKGKKITFDD